MEEIQRKEYDDYVKKQFKRAKNYIENYVNNLNFMPGCHEN